MFFHWKPEMIYYCLLNNRMIHQQHNGNNCSFIESIFLKNCWLFVDFFSRDSFHFLYMLTIPLMAKKIRKYKELDLVTCVETLLEMCYL